MIQRFIPLILAIASLGLLIPGVTLPVLKIEGSIEKSNGFEVAKAMLIDEMLTKRREAALQAGQEFDEAAQRTQTEGGITTVLGMLGVNLSGLEGSIEAYSETRSIMTAVQELIDSGYPFVACLIVLFSMVVPLTKIVCLGVHAITKKQLLLKISGAIAKWSMVDAFVIAIIVSYLAANAYELGGLIALDAELKVGFYFFLAYCLVSIASSQLVSWLNPDSANAS